MSTARVVLVAMPPIQAAVFRAIVENADDLCLEAEHPGPLEAAITEMDAGADVFVVSQDEADVEVICRTLHAEPGLKTVTVSADGRRGALYELIPQRLQLDELSETALLAAIRRARRECSERIQSSLPGHRG